METDYGTVNNMELLYEDVFSFPTQFAPIDFRFEDSGFYDFTEWDQLGMQEISTPAAADHVSPLSEIFLNDQNSLIPEIFCYDSTSGSGSSAGFGDEMKTVFTEKLPEEENELLLLDKNSWALVDEEMRVDDDDEIKFLGKRPRTEDLKSKKLSRETISQYFYMPITQAARELNVGLTLLKKRCRELGIRRWPHRKLISLQTLIKNVQEFGKEGSTGKLKEYLQILEQEKKLLEVIPDMQLEETTKRLRQAFFKANYKKRKLMGLTFDSNCSVKSDDHNNVATNNAVNIYCAPSSVMMRDDIGEEEEDDEEFKYFLADCF